MENLPMVTVEFKSNNPFRCLLSEWRDMGGYQGFLKQMEISISEIVGVKYQVLPASEYPCQAWEG